MAKWSPKYTRYAGWGFLALVCLTASWFTLYGSRTMHIIGGLVLAGLLYFVRKNHRVVYGFIEVAAGIGTLISSYPLVRRTCGTFAESCEPFAWYVIPLASLFAIYVIIRGIDNIEHGFRGRYNERW